MLSPKHFNYKLLSLPRQGMRLNKEFELRFGLKENALNR